MTKRLKNKIIITAILSAFFFASVGLQPCKAAIAYVANSSKGWGGSSSSYTVAHNVGTGDDRALVVTVFNGSGRAVTGITYNGVAMTLVVRQVNVSSANNFTTTYIIGNPASGSNNIVVTFDSATACAIVATSYTGVDTSDPLDAYYSHAGVNQTTDYTLSLTTTVADTWIVAGYRDANNTYTIPAGDSLRVTDGVVNTELADTNESVGAAGSHDFVWDSDGGLGPIDGGTILSLTPKTTASAPAPAPIISPVILFE